MVSLSMEDRHTALLA